MGINNGIEKTDLESLIRRNSQAIDSVKLLKQRILNAHKDYSISKTVGSSVGIAGTVATIAGMALAPFTAGLSLGLTVGGIAGGVLGAGTTLTTGIIETAKSQEWADEVKKSLEQLEEELRRIGEKIVTYPGWIEYVKRAGTGAKFAISVPSTAVNLGRIIKYLAVTAPNYGIQPWPAYFLAAQQLPCQFLLNANNILTKCLSKIGIDTIRIGVKGLQFISVGLGVVGAGLDIYTIVDTWTKDPELACQMDKIVAELEETQTKLRTLLQNEF